MQQKFFSIVAAVLLIFMNAPAKPVLAVVPEKQVKVPYVEARCAIAMDSKTKVVLFEKNSELLVPMASTTKIITALVALKYGNLDKKVEISQRACAIRGSTVGYRKGEQISIRELVYGLMLRSGNDAAIAIAEGVSGSVEDFLRLMNEYASQIGLVDSHFESPHGLDKENHYTTAYDLALVTAKAKEIKEFNDIVSSRDIDGVSRGFTRNFHNINKILWQIPAANGVKTGYTGQAGKCLVSSVRYQDNDIVIVVLNSKGRWAETKKIYDYVISQYEYRNIALKDEILYREAMKNSNAKLELKCNEDICVPVRKLSNITRKVITPENLPKNIERGEALGSLNIYEENKLIYSVPLEVNNSPKSRGMRKFFWFKSK